MALLYTIGFSLKAVTAGLDVAKSFAGTREIFWGCRSGTDFFYVRDKRLPHGRKGRFWSTQNV